MRQSHKILVAILCVFCCLSLSAQVRTITFTGRDWTNHYHIPLHHVTVFNLDQLWEEVLYYPDTTLVLGTVGIEDHELLGIQLMQNVPNPFYGTTAFALVLPENRNVLLEIYDISGKLAVGQQFSELPAGTHLFQATLTSPQTYLLSAKVSDGQMTIKMVNEGHGAGNTIRHLGMTNANGDFTLFLKDDKFSSGYPFAVGDEMKYTGYALIDETMKESNTIQCHQNNNETFTLQFDVTAPTVTTTAASNVTSTTATSGGNITASGGSPITARGVCWSVSHNPTLSNSHTTNGSGSGSFTSNLTGLTSGTTYYVRAYATNGIGTAYGTEKSFTTLSLPTVTTNTVTDITGTTATCGGQVTTDGGDYITARGVCWSTSQNPTISGNHTTNGNGTGNFTSSLTGLSAGTTYYVRAYATNSVGTAYGEQRSFTTLNSCPNTPTVTDYDGNTYNTVQIGSQCWMAENLRTTHYANGTSIALGEAGSYQIPYRYYPDDNSSNVIHYGYFYNWRAVMGNSASNNSNPSGVQGICPNGWHVPSYAEWMQLTNYLQGQSNYWCGEVATNIGKSVASTIGWQMSDQPCAIGNDQTINNTTGFSALPTGCLYDGSNLNYNIGILTDFWCSSQYNNNSAYYVELHKQGALVRYNLSSKCDGYSVRCVKGSDYLPVIITSDVDVATETSIICGGNVISSGSSTVTARGVCWSTSQNPTISGNHTTNGNGTGSFASSITGLSAGITYYVRAYATNSEGTAYGEQILFSWSNPNNGQPCPGAATVTDYDGNVYNTVQIGTQCWMAENLRTTHYANGTNIALGLDTSTTIAYRYYPNNSASNVSSYGYLYNWKAVMGDYTSSGANPSGVQGICPSGWHVPSDAEWTQLTNYVSSQSVYLCNNNSSCIAKALSSTTYWNNSTKTCGVGNTLNTNNSTNFGALPAGYYSHSYFNSGFVAYFWGATEAYTGLSAWYRGLSYTGATVSRSDFLKRDGFSVRCVKN